MKSAYFWILIFALTSAAWSASDDFSNHEANQKIISSYEKAPEQWTKDLLLKVARCYAYEGNLPKAEELFMKVLVEKPDEPIALRGLGNCFIFKQKPEQAAKLFEKGWLLGDVDCLRQLASTYLLMQKVEQIKPLVPDLLKHKDKSMEIVSVLMIYALNANPMDRDVFMKAIADVSDDAILKRPDTTRIAITGFEKFGDLKRAAKLKKEAPVHP